MVRIFAINRKFRETTKIGGPKSLNSGIDQQFSCFITILDYQVVSLFSFVFIAQSPVQCTQYTYISSQNSQNTNIVIVSFIY